MNYIKEINAFYDKIEQVPLSGSAVTLWHALMHINNKAMWKETFTVAAPVLRLKAGLKDSSFKRARTELKEKGYIDYQSRKNNQAPVYWMIGMAVGMDQGARLVGERGMGELVDGDVGWAVDHAADGDAPRHTGQNVGYRVDESGAQHTDWGIGHGTDQNADQLVDHHTDQDTAPLIKRNKDQKKPNQTKRNVSTTTDAFVFYQENFGVVSPFVADALLNWVNDMGEELVLDAMKRALEQGKANWGYVKGILKAWAKKGIRSLEEVKAEEVAFKNERAQRQYRPFEKPSQEVVPEWFEEHERQNKLAAERMRDQDVGKEDSVVLAETAAMLEAFKLGESG